MLIVGRPLSVFPPASTCVQLCNALEWNSATWRSSVGLHSNQVESEAQGVENTEIGVVDCGNILPLVDSWHRSPGSLRVMRFCIVHCVTSHTNKVSFTGVGGTMA